MAASKTLKKTFGSLHKIMSEKNSKYRKKLLAEASKNENIIHSVREISRNLILKNVPLSRMQKKRLIGHTKCIVGCSKIKGSGKKSQQLVVQSGGFLQIILPIIASLLLEKLI